MLFVVEVDYIPAQPVKLIEQWYFDVVAFVELDVGFCFVLGHMMPHLQFSYGRWYLEI